MPSTNASIREPFAPGQVDESDAWTVGGLKTDLRPVSSVAYTRANHEKRVADQLAECGVTHFLPQYESVRTWKDRKVHLKMPLFPGYVFVHLTLQDRLDVL